MSVTTPSTNKTPQVWSRLGQTIVPKAAPPEFKISLASSPISSFSMTFSLCGCFHSNLKLISIRFSWAAQFWGFPMNLTQPNLPVFPTMTLVFCRPSGSDSELCNHHLCSVKIRMSTQVQCRCNRSESIKQEVSRLFAWSKNAHALYHVLLIWSVYQRPKALIIGVNPIPQALGLSWFIPKKILRPKAFADLCNM